MKHEPGTPKRPPVLICWIDKDLPQPKRKAIGASMPEADVYPYAIHARTESRLRITAAILDPSIGQQLLESWSQHFGIDQIQIFDRTTGEPRGVLRLLSDHTIHKEQ